MGFEAAVCHMIQLLCSTLKHCILIFCLPPCYMPCNRQFTSRAEQEASMAGQVLYTQQC